MTAAAISSGRVLRKVPRGALPTAVRAIETIQASCMVSSQVKVVDFDLRYGGRSQVPFCPIGPVEFPLVCIGVGPVKCKRGEIRLDRSDKMVLVIYRHT